MYLRHHTHIRPLPVTMKGAPSKPTSAWQALFANHLRILQLSEAELQSFSGVVAVDIEGPTNERVREIGIAYLPIRFLRMKPDFSDNTLRGFRASHRVEVHTLQISGRRSAAECYHEQVYHGRPKVIAPRDIEAAVLQILERLSGKDARLLLVGFALQREFSFLAEYCPEAASYFSNRSDIQVSVQDICGECRLGLADCLRRCGYFWSFHKKKHNAGNVSIAFPLPELKVRTYASF